MMALIVKIVWVAVFAFIWVVLVGAVKDEIEGDPPDGRPW